MPVQTALLQLLGAVFVIWWPSETRVKMRFALVQREKEGEMSGSDQDRYPHIAIDAAADLEPGESVYIWGKDQGFTPAAIGYRTEEGAEAYHGSRPRPSRILGRPDLAVQYRRKRGRGG
jgi:hypothetical protein